MKNSIEETCVTHFKTCAKRLVVAISGASGAQLGIELLKVMREITGWETHLIVSEGAERTIKEETPFQLKDVESLADRVYRLGDIGASLASGTFKTEGMVIIPCSMNTLGKIAAGISDNLILRAADVTIKEQRKLVLVARECPLSPIHLQNMLTLAKTGVVILPPVLSFYHRPATVDDLIRHIIGKTLDIYKIDAPQFARWGE
jgi:polyprenyl P-hydroxybenzoate/phenylacrylic acid decarboxylase-like protein